MDFVSFVPRQYRLAVSSLAAVVLALLPFSAAQAFGQNGQSAVPTRTTLSASSSASPSASSSTSLTTAAAGSQSGVQAGATLTATVRTTTGSAVSGGTVDFVLPSGQSLGSAIVDESGKATLNATNLPTGATTNISGQNTLNLQAVYNAAGSSDAYAASSSVVTAVATPADATTLPAFNVSGNPTSLTVKQGAYGTSAITVTSVGSYAGSMQFSCSDLPARVTCVFNPTQQVLGANATFVSSLQIQTEAPSGSASSALFPQSDLALALILPGAFAVFGLQSRRRKGFYAGLHMFGVLLLLTGTGLGLSGCSQRYGYLKHPAPVSPGTPTGTYSFTVAIDGSQGSAVTEQTIPITLTVN